MCNKNVNEITNINAYSKSFDFLADEPELYSVSDLKEKYNSSFALFESKLEFV